MIFHHDKKRIKFAWLLMLVYLPMLIAVTFHHHSGAEEASTVSCYDCVHHIHHDGHLTAQQSFTHECVLCQLHSLPYVIPSIIHIASFIAIVHVVFAIICPFIKTRQGNIISTRAPPAFYSL